MGLKELGARLIINLEKLYLSLKKLDLHDANLKEYYLLSHSLVILPQALKLVIPGIANTFLALVKDTPLIFVVGLLEIVGMLNLAKTNPEWLGFAMEGYVFAAIIFWIICYAMSKYSYNLEQKYKTER